MIDFEGINQAAVRAYRSVLPGLIPGGKFRGQEYVVKNPRRSDEQAGSFSVNIKGFWKDFSTGEGGGDFVSLTAFVRGTGQGEAARELAEKLGVPAYRRNGVASSEPQGAITPFTDGADNEIVVPVPADAPPVPVEHFELGKATGTWMYSDATGGTLGY